MEHHSGRDCRILAGKAFSAYASFCAFLLRTWTESDSLVSAIAKSYLSAGEKLVGVALTTAELSDGTVSYFLASWSLNCVYLLVFSLNKSAISSDRQADLLESGLLWCLEAPTTVGGKVDDFELPLDLNGVVSLST